MNRTLLILLFWVALVLSALFGAFVGLGISTILQLRGVLNFIVSTAGALSALALLANTFPIFSLRRTSPLYNALAYLWSAALLLSPFSIYYAFEKLSLAGIAGSAQEFLEFGVAREIITYLFILLFVAGPIGAPYLATTLFANSSQGDDASPDSLAPGSTPTPTKAFEP